MDLAYIKNYLMNLVGTSPTYMSKKISDLITDIDTFEQEQRLDENSELSRHELFKALQRYSDDLKIRIKEFDAIPPEKIKDRSNKAQGVLCSLALLQSSIIDVLNKCQSGVSTEDPLYKYMRTLTEKRDYYASLSITWLGILKAISQETARQVEVMKSQTLKAFN